MYKCGDGCGSGVCVCVCVCVGALSLSIYSTYSLGCGMIDGRRRGNRGGICLENQVVKLFDEAW